jgi:hypothetical protein
MNLLDKNSIIIEHINNLGNNKSFGLCDTPINTEIAFEELVKFFLGEDWYIAISENKDQTNAAALKAIETRYKGNRKYYNKIIKTR